MSKTNNSRDTKRSHNILITGGCGFIGVNLVNYLLKKGFNYIRIIDNLSTGSRENLKNVLKPRKKITIENKGDQIIYRFKNSADQDKVDTPTIDLIIADIRSPEMCLKTTKNINTIIHLAAHTGVIPSIKDPFCDFEINIRGTLNLLSAAVKNKVDKFIFASSNAPLGEQNPPMSEEKIPSPISPYGASKLAGEGYCSAFYTSYGLKTTTLRFSNVYGSYSLQKNSVIAKFFKDGFKKKSLTIYGDGKQTRDFLYVEDLCHSIFLILNSGEAKDSGSLPDTTWGKVFHIGSGKETSIIEISNYLRDFFKDNINITFKPERKGEIKKNYSNIDKAKKVLGYQPQTTLKEGLENTYIWFKNKLQDK